MKNLNVMKFEIFCENMPPHAGADLGGGGGGIGRPSSGIRPPADQKGPPLVLFEKSIFSQPTLKFLYWRQ